MRSISICGCLTDSLSAEAPPLHVLRLKHASSATSECVGAQPWFRHDGGEGSFGDGSEGSFGDGGEGSFGDGGEGGFGDGGERCIATVWGQAEIVDLRGGEWCIATRIHLSVAIQADVRSSKGKSKRDVSGAWQHGHLWGGGCNIAGARRHSRKMPRHATRAGSFYVFTTQFSFSFHFFYKSETNGNRFGHSETA
jgi:hypothetical protein